MLQNQWLKMQNQKFLINASTKFAQCKKIAAEHVQGGRIKRVLKWVLNCNFESLSST